MWISCFRGNAYLCKQKSESMKKSILAALAFALSVPALAENEEVLSDTARVVDLDEVVVVTQAKESFSLRQQPLSSTVLTSQEMTRLNVRDLSQLSQYVPSFTMPSYGSRLTSSMYVRGIGSRVNNPAVGIYYDNIPLMSKSAFNHHFYMLDRVDVLRGPQGTLYGQNTEGGIVRLYTKNPMQYQGTDIHLGLGTGLYSNVEVAHHHRPSDKLAFTVSGFYTGLKGFINNTEFDQKNDLTNEAGGKVRLIFAPTWRLQFDWTADYQNVNQNGFGYGEFHPLPSSVDHATPTAWTSDADNTVHDPSTTLMNGYKRNMLNTGLTVSYEMPRLLFTSTTSYQYLRDMMVMDQDYMAPDYMQICQRQKQNAVTQELVLRSREGSTWQHASGLFASYQWLRTDAPVAFGEAITAPIGNAIANAMKNAMLPAMIARMKAQFIAQGMPEARAEAMAAQAAQAAVDQMGIHMSAEMGVPECFHTPQAALGIFHETNLQLSERWKLTLGLRLNYDKAMISYNTLAYMNMTGGTASATATYRLTSAVSQDNLSKDELQLLPKVGITYSLGQAGNLYALLSKGYRNGGYNFQMFSDILQTDLNNNQQNAMRGDYDVPHTDDDYRAIEETISYKPEQSWNYEAGAHLNLFDGKLHADIAAFFMQLHNQQLSVMSPDYNYGRIMVNAGKSHSCGIEASLRGTAFDGALQWAANYGFTNAKFDEYSETERSAERTKIDYKDKFVPFVPQHTFSAMADYTAGRFTIGLNMAGQGKTWWDEANTFSQKAFATLGAHADYDFGPVIVSLWGRNLTDTGYKTFAVKSSAAGGTRYFAQKATPLQVGIDARIHF